MPILITVTKKQKLILKVDPYLRALFPLLGLAKNQARVELGASPSILYFCLWNIGDAILSFPTLASLRATYPNARISILGKAFLRPLLDNSLWVDEIICADVPWTCRQDKYRLRDYVAGSFPRLVRELRSRRFDVVLDGHNDIRGNLLMWLIGAGRRVGFGQLGGGYFLTDDLPMDSSRSHAVEVLHQLVEHLGAPPQIPLLQLPLSDEHQQQAWARLSELGIASDRFLLAVHPGGGNPNRRWGLDRYAAVIRALKQQQDLAALRVVAFVEPGGYGRELEQLAGVPVLQIDLKQMMAVLSCCDLFLSGDNGPMHIASAVGTPVVALYGPTDPIAWRPWGDDHEIIVLPDFACRPCGDRCKFDQPYCMTQITPELVAKVTEQKIRSLRSRRGKLRNVRICQSTSPSGEQKP